MRRTLLFVGDVEEPLARRLIHELHQAARDGCTGVDLLLSSMGGSTYWGTTLYTLLRGLPMEVTTMNVGCAASVAAAVYCAGRRRTCAPHAKFLLHRSAALVPEGMPALSLERLEERLALAATDSRNLAAILAEGTGRPHHEMEETLRQRRVLDARQAVELGLVHEVRERLHEPAADVVLVC